MNRNPKRSKWWLILLVILLAILCVVVVELMVCRVADPALYARLTAPVVAGLDAAHSTITQAAEDLTGRVTSAWEKAEEAEPPENQLAGEAALSVSLPTVDPTLTRLDARADGDWLTGGSIEVQYFCQSAPEWADKPYGRDNIGAYGCGPAVMAMAAVSIAGVDTDPAQMADWAYQQGYCARGNGSHLSLIQGAGTAFDLTVAPMEDPTADDLLRELAGGRLAVALMTKGHFTRGGHFILLRGVTLDGKVLVADPNSPDRSLIPWDPQLILDELSPSRASGAPLWLLSAAKTAPT